MKTTLATIGYEAATPEDFVATLCAAGVKTLVDVRQVPASRRKGFSKNALRESVEAVGIKYIHLVSLGDPKEGRDAAKGGNFDKFLKIYTAHMQTPEFKADLQEAVEITEDGGACLLCYERDQNECHRKLVAEKISTIMSVKIKHLGVPKGIAKDGRKVRARAGSDSRQSIAACG